ncbi:glycosyltransferase [Yersinia frederiksenii]|uniref:glycosyltransferase n=1 Tax=Yersinia frederiksenii TaxID=29484 RepID=UPI0005EA1392|nr:glycosyltransferase [Yersinia frederiksenii]CNF58411.1 WbcK protein [Yersinia frederiksenii]
MDNKKILSLIIPVYNADKYLGACLNSVFLQWDYTLEVIIINDGSTDKSVDIIDEYKEKFDFLYFSQANTGISAVRNKGLDVSTGEYIAFLDSDDIWCDNIYRTIKKIILTNSPDCVVFNYIELIKNNERKFELIKESKLTIGNNYSVKVEIAKSEMFYPWRFIFKKHTFSGMFFDVGRRYEDQLLIPFVVNKSNSIYESADFILKYRQNPTSITKNINESDLTDSEFGLRRFRDQYSRDSNKYWAIIFSNVFVSHISKCARVYSLNKEKALKSYAKINDFNPLLPIIHSGKIKAIIYFLLKNKMFNRLIKIYTSRDLDR